MGGPGTVNIVSSWHLRSLPVAADKVSYADLKKWYLQIGYVDTERLTITLYSDKNKFGLSKDFDLRRQSGIKRNDLSRRFICGSPFDGLGGYDFDIAFEKVIPETGDVEFFGCQLGIEDSTREAEYLDIGEEFIDESSFIEDANTVI
jgi:hypothetical protein